MNETEPRDKVCTTCGCIEDPQVFEAAWLTPRLLVNSQAICQQAVDIFSRRARSDIRVGEISLVVSCSHFGSASGRCARTAPAAARAAPAAQSELMKAKRMI